MTGGRDGSTVLDESEVLYYPGQYILHHHQVSISHWMWARPDMLYTHLWDEVVPPAMKRLPIPLTGHCLVDLSPRLVLILGGTTVTTTYDWYGRKISSSAPAPTNHLHIYDFDDQSWLSTALPGQEANLTRNQIPRVNHACAKYQEGGRTKVIITGGVVLQSSGQFRATRTTEILDLETFTWTRGKDLPRAVTGAKFIEVNKRPTIIGR